MGLKLETIKLDNFKSFKGTHTISGLDDHFTAIVGPNGSGKSNIIDSVLFVLGYRAKKMRHAMLKDLIHAGCLECKVELIFNEFKIARTLKAKLQDSTSTGEETNIKNCISKYFLNDEEIQSVELSNYLKSKGIDLENNRFLILQGEIENISMMSPIELLSYIEDCIGTSEYKNKIETLDQEIKLKEEEMDVVSNNLKFIETDYIYKKGKRDEKIEFLKFKNDSLALKFKIVKMKGEICRRKEIVLTSEKKEVLGLLQGLEERNNILLKELKEYESKTDNLNLKAHEEKLLKIKREYQRIERNNKTTETKKNQIESEIKKYKIKLDENLQSLNNWEEQKSILNKQFSKNSKDLAQLYQEKNKKIENLDKFKEVKEYEKIKVKNESLIIDLMNKKSIFDKENSEISYLKNKLESIKNTKFEMKKISENDVKKLVVELDQLRNDLKCTSIEIANRKRKADEFRHIEQHYIREKQTLEAISHIKGVHGFLKSLGVIDKRYETAVEAATKSLNSVVVESTRVAEECVSIINKKKLNRTVFIILDRLIEDIPCNETNEEYLFRKISCDNKYVKAFYFALKDTLVVDDLEQARALAFGKVRRRVVTIDGKLFEKSGVMSGGKASKKVKSVDELEKIYENIQKIYEEKNAAYENIKNYENEKILFEKNKNMAKEIEREISERSKNLNTEEIDKINKMIDNLRAEIKKYKEISESNDVKILRNELKSITENIDIFERENHNLKLSLASEPVNEIERISAEINKLEKEYKNLPEIVNIERSTLEEAENEYKFYFDEYKKFQEKITEIRGLMGEDYHEEAEYKSKLEQAEDGLSECSRIFSNCLSKEREIVDEFFMIKNVLVQFNEKVFNFTSESFDFINEMTDSELKNKSKELIDELNRKQSESFNKIKEKHNLDEKSSVEEIEFYKMIFSEYEESRQKYENIKASSDYLKSKLDSLRNDLDSLKSERYSKFMEGFNSINRYLKEIFTLITFGGNAELDLQDFLNPFTEGIVLSVMPPKKSWKQVSNLSGGEKTLSSLSLIFALHKYRPSSFYVMDEIDAALDHKNVSLISQYLSQVDSQFIVISLRNDMFEIANTLLGVYKTKDVSKILLVNLNEMKC